MHRQRPHIPLDLVELIINEAKPNPACSLFSTIALVARDWRHIANKRRFCAVKLIQVDEDADTTVDRVCAFAELLDLEKGVWAAHERLCHYVFDLTIQLEPSTWKELAQDDGPMEFVLKEVFGTKPLGSGRAETRLHFYVANYRKHKKRGGRFLPLYGQLGEDFKNAVYDICSSSCVDTLSLGMTTDMPMDFLTNCTTITTLNLDCIAWTLPKYLDFRLPNLKKLVIWFRSMSLLALAADLPSDSLSGLEEIECFACDNMEELQILLGFMRSPIAHRVATLKFHIPHNFAIPASMASIVYQAGLVNLEITYNTDIILVKWDNELVPEPLDSDEEQDTEDDSASEGNMVEDGNEGDASDHDEDDTGDMDDDNDNFETDDSQPQNTEAENEDDGEDDSSEESNTDPTLRIPAFLAVHNLLPTALPRYVRIVLALDITEWDRASGYISPENAAAFRHHLLHPSLFAALERASNTVPGGICVDFVVDITFYTEFEILPSMWNGMFEGYKSAVRALLPDDNQINGLTLAVNVVVEYVDM